MNTKTYKYPVDSDCTATVRFEGEGEITSEAVCVLIEHLKLFAKVLRSAEEPSKALTEIVNAKSEHPQSIAE